MMDQHSVAYMSWFIPMSLDNYLKMDKLKLDATPWYYFEVEVQHIEESDFGIGLMEFPNKKGGVTDLELDMEKFYKDPDGAGFFDARPGYYDESFGFYLRSGVVAVSKSQEHRFNVEKLF